MESTGTGTARYRAIWRSFEAPDFDRATSGRSCAHRRYTGAAGGSCELSADGCAPVFVSRRGPAPVIGFVSALMGPGVGKWADGPV